MGAAMPLLNRTRALGGALNNLLGSLRERRDVRRENRTGNHGARRTGPTASGGPWRRRLRDRYWWMAQAATDPSLARVAGADQPRLLEMNSSTSSTMRSRSLSTVATW